ncbi:LAMI_0F02454g1_1 [Lachancea mirantina]|uniref:LAMI_0F02454g1_1 n=1 Tax=Lachancea mirantina TaxID=1230905 RepID=A0A1G4JWI8_9SACH|nr:LAMI_0F02454g1_1 [Lachancea mirantina]
MQTSQQNCYEMVEYEFDPQNPLKLRKLGDKSSRLTSTEYADENKDWPSDRQPKRRRDVLIDYDASSDSSNDDSSSPTSLKENETKELNDENDDDDDDMFKSENDHDNETSTAKPRKPKKGIDTLDVSKLIPEDDIFDDEDSQSSSEKEVQMDPFNLKNEIESGAFDRDGNYIEAHNSEDEFKAEDEWINGCNGIKETSRAQEAQLQRRRYEQKIKEKLKKEARLLRIDEALERICFFLFQNETVADVFGRMNKLRAQSLKKESSPGKSNKSCSEPKFVINSIKYFTDIVSILEQKGVASVYELTRAKAVSLFDDETLNTDKANDFNTKQWQFKWLDALDKVNGDFSNYEMQHWKNNYFNDQVIVKYLQDLDEPRNWLDIKTLSFMADGQ